MTPDANKSELMSLEELASVTGGSKNVDNPVVQTVMDSFKKTVKAGQDAQVELLRSSGCLGPSLPG